MSGFYNVSEISEREAFEQMIKKLRAGYISEPEKKVTILQKSLDNLVKTITEQEKEIDALKEEIKASKELTSKIIKEVEFQKKEANDYRELVNELVQQINVMGKILKKAEVPVKSKEITEEEFWLNFFFNEPFKQSEQFDDKFWDRISKGIVLPEDLEELRRI